MVHPYIFLSNVMPTSYHLTNNTNRTIFRPKFLPFPITCYSQMCHNMDEKCHYFLFFVTTSLCLDGLRF